jgi:hypothetical protein
MTHGVFFLIFVIIGARVDHIILPTTAIPRAMNDFATIEAFISSIGPAS